MARKNSIVQLKDVRVGKTVWFIKYGNVLKMQITKIKRDSTGYFITGLADGLQYRYSLGDSGVIDAYDNRPAQVFTNKRAATFFSNYWGKAQPNFLIRLENNQCRGDVMRQFEYEYAEHMYHCDSVFAEPEYDDYDD
jgi:hypothetical protein